MAKMTDVRVGDRVRVTSVVEALVTEVYDGGFSTEGPHYWDRKPDNETREVEVLERRSFRPGTVVVNRLDPDNPAIRAKDRWRGRAGDAADWAGNWSHLTDEAVRRNSNFSVVYEPPA